MPNLLQLYGLTALPSGVLLQGHAIKYPTVSVLYFLCNQFTGTRIILRPYVQLIFCYDHSSDEILRSQAQSST